MKILLIGVGGFIGAVFRYLVTRASVVMFGDRFPYGTLIVNVAGSLVLGYIFTLSLEKLVVSENARFFYAVGVLGAFTTFSTFSVETLYLMKDGAFASALMNIFLNVALSLSAALAGMYIARL
jgi:CrcB protein